MPKTFEIATLWAILDHDTNLLVVEPKICTEQQLADLRIIAEDMNEENEAYRYSVKSIHQPIPSPMAPAHGSSLWLKIVPEAEPEPTKA